MYNEWSRFLRDLKAHPQSHSKNGKPTSTTEQQHSHQHWENVPLWKLIHCICTACILGNGLTLPVMSHWFTIHSWLVWVEVLAAYSRIFAQSNPKFKVLWSMTSWLACETLKPKIRSTCFSWQVRNRPSRTVLFRQSDGTTSRASHVKKRPGGASKIHDKDFLWAGVSGRGEYGNSRFFFHEITATN